MKRYTITEGAMTTAGGRVIKASSLGSINGARIALENDPLLCPSCGTTGHIRCVGPRLIEQWNGKQVALENDLCICRCTPPPRLISNQSLRCQFINDGAAVQSEQQDLCIAQTADAAMAGAEAFDQHFCLIDDVSGRPLIDWHYVIELADGKRVDGRTDQEGKTIKVTSTKEIRATLHVHEPEPARLLPDWDR